MQPDGNHHDDPMKAFAALTPRDQFKVMQYLQSCAAPSDPHALINDAIQLLNSSHRSPDLFT